MKLLVITYYWPPSGGAGVQRWLKFCKYLPEFGVETTVLTTLGGDYPAIDHSLAKDVPESVNVIRTYTPNLNRLSGKTRATPYGSLQAHNKDSIKRKLAIWIRLNLILPDARKYWNRFAIAKGKELLSKATFDAIITTGPPHSTHLIGLKLKKQFGIKWLADFRDPWCDIDYLKNVRRSKLTELLDRRLEQKVVEQCDQIISINQDIIDKIGANEKGVIISNGFDPDDFSDKIIKSKYFSICYFGLISPERNPLVVIDALNQLYESGFDQITLKFYGIVQDKEYLLSLAKYDFMEFYTYKPHSEVTIKMQESQMLLLMINNIPDNLGIITGKIFEYIGSKTPILAIGPMDGEANKILEDSKSGEMFDYSDILAVKNYILNIYQNGYNNHSEIGKYNRRELTKNLVELLK